MKPGKLDLPVVWRGCDYAPVIFRWKDLNGEPFNLTGWTPRARSISINFNPIITNPLGGETKISLTKEQTANLRLGVEPWDWVWENGCSRIPPTLAGNVEIKDPTTP